MRCWTEAVIAPQKPCRPKVAGLAAESRPRVKDTRGQVKWGLECAVFCAYVCLALKFACILKGDSQVMPS